MLLDSTLDFRNSNASLVKSGTRNSNVEKFIKARGKNSNRAKLNFFNPACLNTLIDLKNLWSMKVANNPTTMHKYKNSLVLNG